jgi:hypothetical protein
MPRNESSAIADLVALAKNKPLHLVEVGRDVAVVPTLSPIPIVMTPVYRRPAADRTWPVTKPVVRARRRFAKQVAVVAGSVALIGTAIIGFVAYNGDSGRVAGAAAAPSKIVAAPVPVPAPAPAPAPTPAPTPVTASASLIDIRLETSPSGATVTLVDSGRPRELGKTPLDVSVDRTRAYDVVFALEGHATRIEHFDPRTTQGVAVALQPNATASVPAPQLAAPAAKKPAKRTRRRS